MAEKKIQAWITMNGNHIPIFEGQTKKQAVEAFIKRKQAVQQDSDSRERQMAQAKAEADRLNGVAPQPKPQVKSVFHDGDTPSVINPTATYRIRQLHKSDQKDRDYGELPGSEVQKMLRGFKYEELVPGDGLWTRSGTTYSFAVDKTREGKTPTPVHKPQTDNKLNPKNEKFEKFAPLIFGTARITPDFIDIDGYSDRPTPRGFLAQLAHGLDKYDKAEADSLRTAISAKEFNQIHANKQDGGAQYILEWEEVPIATQSVDANGKPTILSGKEEADMQTKPAKWYVHTRIVRNSNDKPFTERDKKTTDIDTQQRQIEETKKQADELNNKTEPESTADTPVKQFNNEPLDVCSDTEKERRKQEVIDMRNRIKQFYERYKSEFNDTTTDSPMVKMFVQMNKNADDASYHLYRVLTPVVQKEEKWNKQGFTALTQAEGATVRKDLLANKRLFMAIQSAATGTTNTDTKTLNTDVDTLYEKDNSVYDVFAKTREMLKAKYGEEMTLYRAGTNATQKATYNMTSTEKNAQQYGDIYGSKVTASKVKIDDILAINVDRHGNYEEFIVLSKPHPKAPDAPKPVDYASKVANTVYDLAKTNAVNPKYEAWNGTRFTRQNAPHHYNCSICTTAVMLNMRGYNVEAGTQVSEYYHLDPESIFKPNYLSTDDNIYPSNASYEDVGKDKLWNELKRRIEEQHTELDRWKDRGTIRELTDKEMSKYLMPKGSKAVAKRISDKVKQWGNGAYGELSVTWYPDSPHSQFIFNDNGVPVIWDSQCNKFAKGQDEIEVMLRRCKASNTQLLRYDNVPFKQDPTSYGIQSLLDRYFITRRKS